VDVRVLWNRELEEMSPSLRKLIESYVASVRRREQKARKVRTAPGARTFAPVPLAKLPPDARVNGQQFDGVVVEFYVEHAMPMGVGDKVGFDTAMKTIVSDVIPQEEYPYTARRPGEPIEAILSPLSVISRMTTDFYSKLFVNKVIVELKEEVRKIMEG
jgi:DNA-directed RNA polymerase beta subunit